MFFLKIILLSFLAILVCKEIQRFHLNSTACWFFIFSFVPPVQNCKDIRILLIDSVLFLGLSSILIRTMSKTYIRNSPYELAIYIAVAIFIGLFLMFLNYHITFLLRGLSK